AHIPAAKFLRAHPKRAKRPVHRGITQPSGLCQTFAQTDDATESVDHHKPVFRRPGDQQAAVVGAKVNRRVGLPDGRVWSAKGSCRGTVDNAAYAGVINWPVRRNQLRHDYAYFLLNRTRSEAEPGQETSECGFSRQV